MELLAMGGQIRFKRLTNKISESEYARFKAHFWLFLLNEGKMPIKWLKPSSMGTRVNFTYFKGNLSYQEGIKELSFYIEAINEKYGFDFKISEPVEHL